MKKAIHILSLVIFTLSFAAGCSTQQNPEPIPESSEPFPIIDVHMHTYQWNSMVIPPAQFDYGQCPRGANQC
jgi:hypothetical protein